MGGTEGSGKETEGRKNVSQHQKKMKIKNWTLTRDKCQCKEPDSQETATDQQEEHLQQQQQPQQQRNRIQKCKKERRLNNNPK